MKLTAIFFCFYFFSTAMVIKLYGNEWPFQVSPGGHHGKINTIIQRGNHLISAGDDGFLGIWDIQKNVSIDRYQISPFNIIAMADRPSRDELCVIERDILGVYRLSVWNYRTRRNIFTIPMDNPISYITYSIAGNYIIASGSQGTGLLLIDSNTGKYLQTQPLIGNISLAITGLSERNIMLYRTSGEIVYWDVELKKETHRFDVSENLKMPVLLSKNRFLAGITGDGLLIFNAVNGGLIDRDISINRNALLYTANDELLCFIKKDKETVEIINYRITTEGSLLKYNESTFSLSGFSDNELFTAVTAIDNTGNIALGSASGITAMTNNGRITPMAVKDHLHIDDITVFGENITFITDNGVLGIIPLDYKKLLSEKLIYTEQNIGAYNRISTFDTEGANKFILWQDKNTLLNPVLYSYNSKDNKQKQDINRINIRSPLRSVVSYNEKIMFLDSGGNLSLDSPLSNTENHRPFSYFSVGLLDAAFIDNDHLLLGRSDISNNSVFLSLNINTGETVNIPYPSKAGLAVYRGKSGSIYAVSVSPDENNEIKSSVLLLDPSNISNTVKLTEFKGEASTFSLAESPGGFSGSLAVTFGGEEAAIFSANGTQKLERTHSYPIKFTENEQFLIYIDSDGCLSWLDYYNGKTLAVFWLSPNGWNLHTDQGTVTGGF